MPMSPRLLRPRQAGGFDPRRIAGLEWWIDASDTAAVTLDSGRVATLQDKSGNGLNASNLTSGTTQPALGSVNGRNVASFTAASQQFLVAGSIGDWDFLHDGTNITLYVVGTVPNNSVIISTGGAFDSLELGFSFDGVSSSRARVFVANGSAAVFNRSLGVNAFTGFRVLQVQTFPTAANLAARATICVNDDTDDAVSAFGTLAAAPSASNSTAALNIGRASAGTNYYGGSIAEILVYDRTLSQSERFAVRNYLGRKWAVNVT
jgi:hypothetical protein